MNKLFLIILLLPSYCLGQLPKVVTISGEINMTKPARWIYLTYNANGNTIKDSVELHQNKFLYEINLSSGTAISVEPKLDNSGQKADPILLYLIPGNKIELNVKNDFTNYSVKGSPVNNDFQAMVKSRRPYLDSIDNMWKRHTELSKIPDEEAMKNIREKIAVTDRALKNEVYLAYFNNHFNSPLSFYALVKYAGIEIDPAVVEPLYAKLSPEVKKWPSAITFKNALDVAKATSTGAVAPNFVMKDTSGRNVSLSSFKGKYVLLDFWASWCSPCRFENPYLVNLFNEYNKKGFTIVSVSLDKPGKKDDWINAIHNDKLNWTQVSELTYFDAPVVKKYGIDITGVPFSFLINPEGIIVAKGLRHDGLEKKLSEIFSNVN